MLGSGRTVGVEDPGYPSLRRVPPRLGSTVRALPTDDAGLVCDDLPTGSDAPHVVVVTPSHQYPLGGSLPVARRQALLDWARSEHVVVVEDDYASELRYTSAPLPALAALDDPDDGCVVGVVERGERREWSRGVAELGGVVVLDDHDMLAARPVQERLPTGHGERTAQWVLVAGRDDHDVRRVGPGRQV